MGWDLGIIIARRGGERAGEWIVEEILEPFRDWVIAAIEEIRVNLRNFLHTLKETLARWLELDWFFFLFVVGIVAAIVFLPKLADWFKNTEVWKTVSTFADKVINRIVSLIDINKYIDLKFLDTVLKTFVDEYRETRIAMANSVAGLAADLGHGTGFINGLVESARGTYVGTAAVLGLDPRMAEIQWYNDATVFTRSVNDRFYHYAHDPGAIYYDFFTNVLLPRATEMGQVQQAELDQIRENFNRLQEFEGGLRLVEDSVNEFILLMPAEIEFQFARRWDDIKPYLDDLLAVLAEELIPKFRELVSAFEERERMQRQINEAVASRMNDPLEVALSFGQLDEEAQRLARDAYLAILSDGATVDATKPDPEAMRWQSRLDQLTDSIYGSAIVPSALGYEAVARAWSVGRPRIGVPSPFVGEY